MLWVFLTITVTANVINHHGDVIRQFQTQGSRVLRETICPSYHCTQEPLDEFMCGVYAPETHEYHLQRCPEGYFCAAAMNTESNMTCLPYKELVASTYPGSPCTSDADCQKRNHCNDQGVCQAGRQGDTCNIESACDPGYICYREEFDFYCTKQPDFGAPCRGFIDDSICRNDAVCGMNTCVPWFSLPNGAYTISAYAAYACASGFYTTIPGRSDIVICAKAPKSPASQLPRLCVPGSLCHSSDGQFSLPCQCGLNPSGSSFCPLFPGDDLYQSYLSLLKTYSKYLANCAFSAIGQLPCGAPESVWKELNRRHVEVETWGLKEDNDDCVKEIFTSAYWDQTYS